ncbi:hypothetical protein DFP93_104175 [Aneurinibacillus soli]|uniref:Uncharacterized protein n=1 Tax=Aneurinibacillus soli TaxID=1500254 RepID=A0A0U5B1B6_9BACL|nr:hypothetical protein [Aneurinibacillus soli]PYE62525.1 hypothetical protein DFP93_104175 [Aneurinibacillus soli]BAU27087.1 hypothetical protein CB4_01256 [Aneurinibacillus soli]
MKESFSSCAVVEALIHTKEEIKNKIMDPSITWEERLLLYEAIQRINKYIKEIREG